jgi:hypothetical protein
MRSNALLVALAVAAVVVLAGCSLTAFTDEATTPGTSVDAPAPDTNGSLADPESDVKGWENGVWYNESLPVDASDGLNESELAMVVNRSLARVEHVRNVEFDEPVPVSIISRDEYADRIGAGGGGGDDAPSPAAREESARMEALFLVGETSDAQEEQADTRSASVQGFYSPSEDEITIVAPTDTPTVDEVTLAHEVVHAYQFRGHLDVRFPQSPTRDERRALVSLIEGDANLVDALVTDRCGDEWSCIGHGGEDGDDGGGDGTATATGDSTTTRQSNTPRPNMGLYLLSYFPYAEGEEYVRSVREDGGWSAVNDLYGDPPTSTELVIHRNGDDPASVSIDDRSGDSWTRVGPTNDLGIVDGEVLGEADVATMFAATLYDDREGALVTREAFLQDGPVPIDYGLPPSDGWAGDRFYAYETVDGDATGYVWRVTFDSEGEAREFANAYRDLLRYHDATRERDGVFEIPDGPYEDAFRVTVDGSAVTIVNAPTDGALDAVHDAPSNRLPTDDSGTAAWPDESNRTNTSDVEFDWSTPAGRATT